MTQTPSRTSGTRTASGRTLGALTMAAGALFALGALVSTLSDWAWLGLLAGFALLVYVVPGLHGVQAPADGWAGRLGAPLVAAGAAIVLLLGIVYLVWEAVGDPGEPAWAEVAWMVGFLAFLVGIVLFGVGSTVAGVFPRAAALLLLGGLVASVVIDMATGAFFEDDGSTTEWGFFIGIPLFGAGLAWIGYALGSGHLSGIGDRSRT